MDAQDNKGVVDMYRARTHKAEIAIANIVASAPSGLKIMELASILGKTVVPHGSDFSATFGVGRLTEFLEGNDCFCLEGHCPKNLKVIQFTPKGQTLEVTVFPWPPKLRRDPVPPQHLIPAHHPALKPGQVTLSERLPMLLFHSFRLFVDLAQFTVVLSSGRACRVFLLVLPTPSLHELVKEVRQQVQIHWAGQIKIFT